jgi:hypothetical protein
MNIALKAGERSGQSTVCRFSEPTLEAVEASVARLKSWANVREVQLAGGPFIRLNGAERMVVHLPIVGCADPRPETGVIPGRLQPGKTAAVEHVSFAEAVELAPRLAAQLERACGLSGPVEFHASGDSFTHGLLVFPVMDAPGVAVRQEFAAVL